MTVWRSSQSSDRVVDVKRFTKWDRVAWGRAKWSLPPALLLLLAGCAKNAPQTALESKGPVAESIYNLSAPVFIIAGIVFLLVEGLVLVAAIKFRDRGGDREPKQVHGNTRLEVGWTLIPALILFAVAIPTIKTIFDLSRTPANAMKVTVTGHQFWWEYRYDDLGIVTANELHLPVGRPVELHLESNDVIHSFWVPAFAGKTDVIPGRHNRMTFTAGEEGRYPGQCTEYCGLSHANMRNWAVAQTPADFDAWVVSQRAPAGAEPPAGTEAAEGFTLFSAKGCSGCHTVEGVSRGKTGPNLTHLFSRETFAGSMFTLNAENLRPWLANPPGVKPGSRMPNLKLSSNEITKLIAYLETLR